MWNKMKYEQFSWAKWLLLELFIALCFICLLCSYLCHTELSAPLRVCCVASFPLKPPEEGGVSCLSPFRATGSPRILLRVSGGIFSKASLVGAKTVYWPSLSSMVVKPAAAMAVWNTAEEEEGFMCEEPEVEGTNDLYWCFWGCRIDESTYAQGLQVVVGLNEGVHVVGDGSDDAVDHVHDAVGGVLVGLDQTSAVHRHNLSRGRGRETLPDLYFLPLCLKHFCKQSNFTYSKSKCRKRQHIFW